MRSSQKSNRARGRGNRKGGGNTLNRVYDSAGPEGKVRGTPQQIIDKYVSLARDAQTSGDRVAAENFLQHAEHYQRLLIQAMGAQEQQRREQPDTEDDSDAVQAAGSNGRGDADEQPREDPAAAEQPVVVSEAVDGSPTDQPNGAAESADAPTAEIGGMAMIDGETGSESLLVGEEDLTKSQPRRRNGDGRRKRKAPEEEAPTEPEAQPDP